MPATSRMWRSTPWMRAVSWRPLRAGAPAGEQRLGRPMRLQIVFPRVKLHRVRTSYSRPIQRWPCLIRSGLAVEAVVPAAEEKVAPVAGAEVRAEAAREAAVKAAPVEAVAPVAEEKVAPVAVAEEAALAAEGTIPGLTITTRPTVSHGQSCRHSHLRLRPTNRSWRR